MYSISPKRNPENHQQISCRFRIKPWQITTMFVKWALGQVGRYSRDGSFAAWSSGLDQKNLCCFHWLKLLRLPNDKFIKGLPHTLALSIIVGKNSTAG